MHITLVELDVKKEHLNEFLEALRINQIESMQEPGNLRFDVLQHPDAHNKILIYEAYANASAAAAHKETQHYASYVETVKNWFQSPRKATLLTGLWLGPVAPGIDV